MERTFEEYRAKMKKDPAFVKRYNDLEPEYQIIRQIIETRIQQNMTQKDLADRVGTCQSNIARLESGNYNPSLQFLKKLAEGLGKNLSISFV